jgi:hypothetical protein
MSFVLIIQRKTCEVCRKEIANKEVVFYTCNLGNLGANFSDTHKRFCHALYSQLA